MKQEEQYQTHQVWIKPGHRLFLYFQVLCGQAKNLYNTTNFFIRQTYTALKQESDLQPLQQEVLDMLRTHINTMNEVQLLSYQKREAKELLKSEDQRKIVKPNFFSLPTREEPMLNYNFLDALFKAMKQENYRSLPTQSSQNVMKIVFQNWKSYFESLKVFRKNPSAFKAKPRIPSYCRNHQRELILTNQDCVIKEGKFLKLPLTKERLNIGKLGYTKGKLMQVRVIPSYGRFFVELVFSCEITEQAFPKERVMAIDLGIDNLATIVTNTGKKPTLVKGKVAKAMNQYYNKQKAHYLGILRQGKKPNEGQQTSHRLVRLNRKRFLKMKDFFHKASYQIIQLAVEEQIGTIIIGRNTQWKSETNMGKRNNQSFCHIPHKLLIQMMTYKAKRLGIEIIVREESYTSKASFLDGDAIPTYGESDLLKNFSGNRIHRGMYRSKAGICINADVNGAYNIMRKEVPNALANGIEGLDNLMAVAVSTPLVLNVL
ncbi:IS200/IS605 family element transposase accessory protein TnpB [Paenibacillus taichungensis]|uniref:IS200/IS605 family element transposase accessory protein TnpB n=1 Tax=Paenibacillus taichungensis TaxID=484184 RepID=A0ABX2MLD6_9BACL|nr:RNA-guided endonuclease TnpB family protein [Paenibacillus taichungensis]NUU54840.1 IS200/IS605 family element transposase accessory protein TnpB [Paenibacillus taichungensis]